MENDYNEYNDDELNYVEDKDSNEFFDGYFDFISESEDSFKNSESTIKNNNINEQDINILLYNDDEEYSSKTNKSKSKIQLESNKNNSTMNDLLSRINSALNQNTIIINLIQVNDNYKKENNHNNNEKNTKIKKNKNKNKTFKRMNNINIDKIKLSFDVTNFYTINGLFKYISMIYLKHLNHLRNKFENIKNAKTIVKCVTIEYNFTIFDLLNYICSYFFSSIYKEEKNIYISFLTNNMLVFFKGKRGKMVLISYPYGYLLANILYKININCSII